MAVTPRPLQGTAGLSTMGEKFPRSRLAAYLVSYAITSLLVTGALLRLLQLARHRPRAATLPAFAAGGVHQSRLSANAAAHAAVGGVSAAAASPARAGGARATLPTRTLCDAPMRQMPAPLA